VAKPVNGQSSGVRLALSPFVARGSQYGVDATLSVLSAQPPRHYTCSHGQGEGLSVCPPESCCQSSPMSIGAWRRLYGVHGPSRDGALRTVEALLHSSAHPTPAELTAAGIGTEDRWHGSTLGPHGALSARHIRSARPALMTSSTRRAQRTDAPHCSHVGGSGAPLTELCSNSAPASRCCLAIRTPGR